MLWGKALPKKMKYDQVKDIAVIKGNRDLSTSEVIDIINSLYKNKPTPNVLWNLVEDKASRGLFYFRLSLFNSMVTRLSLSGHPSLISSPSHQGILPPNWKVERLGKIS